MSVEAPTAPSKGGLRLSLFQSIRPYRPEWLSRDVVAGITLAALAIPDDAFRAQAEAS
jgi:MFS superfamily sulfate permease-like transporter